MLTLCVTCNFMFCFQPFSSLKNGSASFSWQQRSFKITIFHFSCRFLLCHHWLNSVAGILGEIELLFQFGQITISLGFKDYFWFLNLFCSCRPKPYLLLHRFAELLKLTCCLCLFFSDSADWDLIRTQIRVLCVQDLLFLRALVSWLFFIVLDTIYSNLIESNLSFLFRFQIRSSRAS